MLRVSYMDKYREKTKFDALRFLKQDDDYMLKQNLILPENLIRKLPREKLDRFIDDILTDKKTSQVLFDSIAEREIKLFQKERKKFENNKEELEKLRKLREEPSNVVKKRSRREAFLQMRSEIDAKNYENERKKITLTNKNNKCYNNFKKELQQEYIDYFKDLRENRLNGFERAYDHVMTKLQIQKINEQNEKKENDKKNLTTKNATVNTLTESTYPNQITTEGKLRSSQTPKNKKEKLYLPDIKLEMTDVFSRLYNNAVYIEKKKQSLSKEPSTKSTFSKNIKKNKIKFTLKPVLSTVGGKEFTIKITPECLDKCFTQYSGGPEFIQHLEELRKESKNKKAQIEIRPDTVDFYNKPDENGNTCLHIATIENHPELVEYFIEKGTIIDKQNNDGDTALHIAARRKNDEICDILIRYKAALDVPNNKDEIPFEFFNLLQKEKFGIDKLNVINPRKVRH